MPGHVQHTKERRMKRLEEQFFQATRVRPVEIYKGNVTSCDCRDGETKNRRLTNCYAIDFNFGPKGWFTIEDHLSLDGLPYCVCLWHWPPDKKSPTVEEHFKCAYISDKKYDHVRDLADPGAKSTGGPFLAAENRILELLGVR